MNINITPKTHAKDVQGYALFALFFAYFPHWLTSPLWINALVFAVFILQLITWLTVFSVSRLFVKGLVFFLGILGLALHIKTMTPGDFFINFFILAIFLKVIEAEHIRDYRVIALATIYLMLTALLLIQEVWIMAWMLLTIFVQLGFLLKMTASSASIRDLGIANSKALLWSIPIALVLFYFFPRLNQQLWQVPSFQGARIGFSDSLSLGSISELFYNSKTAMRVRFATPPKQRHYWRGAVLANYNGVDWVPFWYPNQYYQKISSNFEQSDALEIVMEPTGKPWLFYLDRPTKGSPSMMYNDDSGLIQTNRHSISQRFRYTLQTQKKAQTAIDSTVLRRNLFLPPYVNPNLQAWAKKISKEQGGNEDKIIKKIKEEIQSKPFWYTLTPKPLSKNHTQLDSFWFSTREGYCEHYASAVTVILRAAGIPARLIVGYYGGTWNPIGEYLEIKQSDAHAWLEYWHRKKGWTRLDATSFIPIERIDTPIRERLSQSDASFSSSSYFEFLRTWQKMQYYFESARFFLERWLLFYNQESQLSLFKHLGFKGVDAKFLQNVFVATILVAFILYWLMHYRRSTDSLIEKEKKKWGHFLKKQKLQTLTHKSFMQQCYALAKRFPKHKHYLRQRYKEYEKNRLKTIRYGRGESDKKVAELLKAIRLYCTWRK